MPELPRNTLEYAIAVLEGRGAKDDPRTADQLCQDAARQFLDALEAGRLPDSPQDRPYLNVLDTILASVTKPEQPKGKKRA